MYHYELSLSVILLLVSYWFRIIYFKRELPEYILHHFSIYYTIKTKICLLQHTKK